MIHPATAHFAMVLPVVAATLGAIYMVKRNEGMAKLSSIATIFTAIAVGVVWYTGSHAGPEIFEYLSPEGKKELLEHKQLGLYLAIAFGVIAVLKAVGCRLKIFALEAVAIVALFAGAGTVFLQGKDGGEIVYNYGMPFKAYGIESTLKEAVATADDTEDCDEKVEAYEDAIDDISSYSEEVDALYGNKHEEASDEEE